MTKKKQQYELVEKVVHGQHVMVKVYPPSPCIDHDWDITARTQPHSQGGVRVMDLAKRILEADKQVVSDGQ